MKILLWQICSFSVLQCMRWLHLAASPVFTLRFHVVQRLQSAFGLLSASAILLPCDPKYLCTPHARNHAGAIFPLCPVDSVLRGTPVYQGISARNKEFFSIVCVYVLRNGKFTAFLVSSPPKHTVAGYVRFSFGLFSLFRMSKG